MKSIFTIGYEGLSIIEFINKLNGAGVQSLIDVRKNAISRKKGFSKTKLREACDNHTIRYFHYPSLGIPTEARKGIKSKQDYDNLFTFYRNSIIPHEQDTIKQVLRVVLNGNAALLCFEADPSFCHRSHLAAAIAKANNLKVQNL